MNIKVDFAIDPEHLEENIYNNILYQHEKKKSKAMSQDSNKLPLINHY